MGDAENIDFSALDGSTKTPSTKGPGDFPSLFADLFMKVNWKMAFLLFIIFIALTSDVFIDKFMTKIKGSVVNRETTNKGTVIQAILLVLFYIILDGIISSGLL